MARIELGFSQFYTIDTTRVNYQANQQNKTYLPSKETIGVAKWVSEEPERIPGNTLFPNMRTAATIIPEGAHMGEA